MGRSGTRPRTLVVVVLAAVALLAGALPAQAAGDPYCGIRWGSLPESRPAGAFPPGTVSDVRTGQHPCFDRLVVDLAAADATGYDVRYVDQVGAQGSGTPVPVAGGAVLQLLVRAPAYDESRGATYLPEDPARVVDVTGARTLRQVAWAGSFEGQTSMAVGTRARLPVRVFVLDGAPGRPDGARVVVDVAHHW
ncbi:hypothetical protein GCM10023328_39330 [Modestobacter marinus]|uniref:AMIN-like domain-containing protein n=1 Tax=Modestobacter marinus TaxID=477641 RepID=A0A846LH19_9ACTN|nr:hypothetical protein [Modestobacter marinus]NIH65894.1 hypothetical protein [Modestobacter marinus]GGL67882.1 hypothetical protein GCM10011589_25330 [Modestobacter marinus]